MNDKKEEVKVVKETWQYSVHYRNMGGKGVKVAVLPDQQITRLITQQYSPGDVAKAIAETGFTTDGAYIVPSRILQIDFKLVPNA